MPLLNPLTLRILAGLTLSVLFWIGTKSPERQDTYKTKG